MSPCDRPRWSRKSRMRSPILPIRLLVSAMGLFWHSLGRNVSENATWGARGKWRLYRLPARYCGPSGVGGAAAEGAESFCELMPSLSSLLGLKKGTLRAGTATCSPVLGLRPMRARRWRVRKLPKPRISILSPARSDLMMLSKMVSTITSLSRRVIETVRDTSSIRSALVMSVKQNCSAERGQGQSGCAPRGRPWAGALGARRSPGARTGALAARLLALCGNDAHALGGSRRLAARAMLGLGGDRFRIDKLVKTAPGLVVVHQLKAFFIKDLEKIVPIHLRQAGGPLRIELEPQHAVGAADDGGTCVMFGRPALNFGVIASRVRGHAPSPCVPV